MSVAEKFGGETLAKLAISPPPDQLGDEQGNSLRLQLSGFVQVWHMDDDASSARLKGGAQVTLARPRGKEKEEVTRCDWAVFQSGVPANEKARHLCLVEIKNSIGGDTADRVRMQLEGGLNNVLLELAEGENSSFNMLTPIFVYGCRSIGKHDKVALDRVSLTHEQGTAWLIMCKSGSTLKDDGIIDPPVN